MTQPPQGPAWQPDPTPQPAPVNPPPAWAQGGPAAGQAAPQPWAPQPGEQQWAPQPGVAPQPGAAPWPGAVAPHGHPTAPVPAAAQPASALPVEPREHHDFYLAPRWRWWRGLLALLMATGIALAASLLLGIVQVAVDMALGNPISTSMDDIHLTPTLFLVNNVTIATFIPAAMLSQWACTGQRPRWLSSVAGGVRWRWLLACVGICLPIWLVLTGVEVWQTRGWEGLAVNPATWVLLVGILLTTPFQAAGEEYLVRGLLFRVVAAWTHHRIVGLVLGAVVSGLVFMSLHMAADPWLNVFYFTFGVMAALMAWRTGGLEAPIALHVVNNMTAEWNVPFTDISGMMDRSVGTGDWTVLFPLLAIVVAWALMEVAARRMGIVRRSAPGAVPTTAPVPVPLAVPTATPLGR